ncbi:unnamed protein product, partial [marine sediment metagenome]
MTRKRISSFPMPASRRFPLLLIGAFLALYLVWGSTKGEFRP